MTSLLVHFCSAPMAQDPIALDKLRYFNVPARPTMDELRSMLRRTGYGEVTSRHLDSLKGIHFSAPGGGYDIHYRNDLWDGSSAFTVVHETYEITHETLWDMDSGDAPDRNVCREAERFAAAVLMQPRAFEPLALEWGLDVLALQRAFRCSYASVTIRLGRGAAAPAPHGDPVREGGRRRPRRLDRAARPPGDGSAADAGLRDSRFLPHLRLQGRRPPQGQAPPGRLPGRAGCPLRHGAVRPRRRLHRHSPARRLEGEAGKGSRHRRAGPRRSRPRHPGDRLRRAGTRAVNNDN